MLDVVINLKIYMDIRSLCFGLWGRRQCRTNVTIMSYLLSRQSGRWLWPPEQSTGGTRCNVQHRSVFVVCAGDQAIYWFYILRKSANFAYEFQKHIPCRCTLCQYSCAYKRVWSCLRAHVYPLLAILLLVFIRCR